MKKWDKSGEGEKYGEDERKMEKEKDGYGGRYGEREGERREEGVERINSPVPGEARVTIYDPL